MPTTIALAALGWISAGLVRYLADVLPIHRKLAPPTCPACQARKPFLRSLLWPAACPGCGYRRAGGELILRLAMTLAAIGLALAPPAGLGLAGGFLLLVYFSLVVLIDLERRLVLHPVSLAGALLALGVGLARRDALATLLGGLAGFAIMLGFYFLGSTFTRLMSRWKGWSIGEEALGFGDVILSGVLGLMLGWPGILAGLTLGIALGGLTSLAFLAGMALTRQYRAFTAIPYGPFLVAGAAALIYFRDFFIASLFN